ncbi:GIY-YIG catalytic domain containing protein [Trichomonas vaginalis G3]|uniref:Structure-specific endonuclease subunit SLX1 homolog n=1 Tax=Trichomonas vaginalis (strain ATCC PRA-98 / G3) TaxID=412133 RepID=A2F2W8_TRIV3|nr:5'-flap endonuclease protein [Trichomonas vaginalis G3]EAY00761.1 GIY-YIG catalytic domain containing protein [Trichomonas vaginalis G3]KAI5530735.1 5'-flap endonuclease protein [Trichomonas vaginalis G3]|eukprot:XP_001313690.1 GIY-YIG catalytic domain containing protein [Trichomonas vaginalis G3]
METFAGCYILRSQNPQYKTHCYIGFTVNPPRRIKQHNGARVGGAFKTHTMRPWEMTLVVWGFPTKKLALKFEWTWQHPTEAKSLKHINFEEFYQREGGPRKYNTNLKILKEMLLSQQWNRLSLRICVQCKDVYEMLLQPPVLPQHIKIELGSINDLPIDSHGFPSPGEYGNTPCPLCNESEPPYNMNWVVCPFCGTLMHLKCMALRLISQSPSAGTALIPTHGSCPSCKENIIWRDLVELRNQIQDEEE